MKKTFLKEILHRRVPQIIGSYLIASISLIGSAFLFYLGIRSFLIAISEIQNYSTRKLHLKELILAQLLKKF